MTTYQYLLKHPHSRRHRAYLETALQSLRAYHPAKRAKRNAVKEIIIRYESLLDNITLGREIKALPGL